MPNKIRSPFLFLFVLVLIVLLACNLPGMIAQQNAPQIPTDAPTQIQPTLEPTLAPPQPTETLFSGESNLPEIPTATSTPVITHIDVPVDSGNIGLGIYDV